MQVSGMVAKNVGFVGLICFHKYCISVLALETTYGKI